MLPLPNFILHSYFSIMEKSILIDDFEGTLRLSQNHPESIEQTGGGGDGAAMELTNLVGSAGGDENFPDCSEELRDDAHPGLHAPWDNGADEAHSHGGFSSLSTLAGSNEAPHPNDVDMSDRKGSDAIMMEDWRYAMEALMG